MADWVAKTALAKAVFDAGFCYDAKQDIIYSKLDARQRFLGYTWPYDVAAASLQMIIDCEPFYFSYGGKLWLIELWKGQYGVETGCEIGVYRDDIGRGLVESNPRTRFFTCVSGGDMPRMSFTLYRKGLPFLHHDNIQAGDTIQERDKIQGLFQRKPYELFSRGPQHHFWLTGFKWGVFTGNTLDLRMDIEIVFKNTEMRDAFKHAAKAIGYHMTEKDSLSVRFAFDRPHTHQPSSRIALQGKAQARNQALVTAFELYKREKKIPSNDPNEFTALDAPTHRAVRLAGGAATKIQRAASSASRKLGGAVAAGTTLKSETAAAVGRLPGEVSDETRAAYNEVFAFYDRKVWRTTR